MELGKMQTLRIVRVKEFGAYLSDETEAEAVLLPGKLLPEGKGVGDTLEVFLYRDSQDRMIATTVRPVLEVGTIGKVEVKDVTPIGAFVDIGLEKDVLVPHREMRYEPKKGEYIEVYLYIDRSGRLAASMYTMKHTDAVRVEDREIRQYHYDRNAELVLKLLKEKYDGHVPYTDKTVQSQQILQDFGLSKAAFKRALGKLLKEEKVKITKTSIFCKY